jgi:hypothetical protein
MVMVVVLNRHNAPVRVGELRHDVIHQRRRRRAAARGADDVGDRRRRCDRRRRRHLLHDGRHGAARALRSAERRARLLERLARHDAMRLDAPYQRTQLALDARLRRRWLDAYELR